MNIEIITTDTSTCNDIVKSIEEIGHAVRLSICLNKSNLDEVVLRKPDLVILSQKDILIENEENICLSEYFELNSINFSGSTKEALKYNSDKVLTKSYLKEQGHNTANYFTATPGEYVNDNKIPIRYPLFIKPNSSANGNGIDDLSYVTNYAQFESKVLSLYNTYNEPVLVEEYLESQEFTVALLKTKDGDLLVSTIEVIPTKSQNGIKILGLKTRIENKEEFKKTQDSELINRVKNIAVNAFMDLGARDFAQIDIKTNSYGHCFLMGANLLPDIKDVSSYLVKACEIEHGLSYNEIIEIIINKGISRI
ncbi:D-alanine--D-alanine ligase [Candidatus Sulfurimonas marisnigri]|uniref:D-alanine--D-alanine ligase n=1 Tax=Candidatus Sulfurimonas marisnigri TaxID=2740405 RepID=A0A7S7RQS6_9BACT|nr:D-alanine--D-alanine ligase [Candidatus Sulfurimonas marisnigri]QOY55737.1 D-alanine--D-alanine ligase [Candidatus Sulfurimonas marisnigri]